MFAYAFENQIYGNQTVQSRAEMIDDELFYNQSIYNQLK